MRMTSVLIDPADSYYETDPSDPDEQAHRVSIDMAGEVGFFGKDIDEAIEEDIEWQFRAIDAKGMKQLGSSKDCCPTRSRHIRNTESSSPLGRSGTSHWQTSHRDTRAGSRRQSDLFKAATFVTFPTVSCLIVGLQSHCINPRQC